MTALRFAAGVGAGVAMAALVAGAATGVAPAAEPDGTAQPATQTEARPTVTAPAATPARTAPAAKASVERGVLARAAASKRAKPREAGAPPQAPHGAQGEPAKDPKQPVIESVEVDWGGAPSRP